MMLRSFVEFGKRGQATQENDLERHQAKIEELEYLEDKLDGTDFKMFVEYVNNIIQIRKQLIHEVKETGSSKLLHPGRIIQIKKSSPAIILKESLFIYYVMQSLRNTTITMVGYYVIAILRHSLTK